MKLKDYLTTAKNHGEIVAFNYTFNGERNEDGDIEDFSIGTKFLRLEDLKFNTEAEGEIVEGVFVFDYEGDTIGVEPLY